jgi:hypothetical protein
MNLKRLFVAVSPALLVLGIGVANAGQTVNEEGVLACVNDKWDEKEVDKGHKLVDYAGRCMTIPSDPAAEKVPLDCVGKYEYMPDGSWKGSGTCIHTYKNGDKLHEAWEEGSQLKAYPYKLSDGTGKHQGVSGDGTYFYEQVTDALSAGTYKGQLVLP